MKPGPQLKRRGFIGAALVGLGGAIGWAARKSRETIAPRKAAPTELDSRFAYDISEFERTDPAILLYHPASQFDTGFERVRRIMASSSNQVWIAGDRAAKRFHPDGTVETSISFSQPAHCLRETGSGDLLVGFRNFFELFDSTGKSLFQSPRFGEKTYLASAAFHRNTLYLADAGNREVLICDRDSGSLLDRFGKQDRERSNPGFAIPSPYFDLALAPDNLLRIVNPGRLRIETYSLDGRFQSAWGDPGMQIDRFCGCCNPVYFALTSGGDFITSEKGLARIKIYSADGSFKGAVAGPDLLVDDKELAKRACEDCSVGASFDIAVSSDGAILALDPFRKSVRFFIPNEHS